MKRTLFCLLLLLCGGGCALAPLRPADAEAPLETPTVVATLPCNPTTGYNWEAQWNEKFCHVELKFIPPDESMLGAPGETQVIVTMHKAVKTRIWLTYRRPWEKQVPPAVKKTLIVRGMQP